MAASPTGWSSPGRVTRPTPGPPRMAVPPSALRRTVARMGSPWVASTSSPPSFSTEQAAVSPSVTQSSRGASTIQSLGVFREIRSGARPVRSSRTAPAAAMAAQVPVVRPQRRRFPPAVM